jgi:dipeptidyl aminopeptidase/acylaminoacyl peptidase
VTLIAWLLAAAFQAPPPSIKTENVPPIPAEIPERLAQYQNMRGARFLDWAPDGGSMLIRTRFADTLQLHRVHAPGGRREQITFFDEPVEGAFYAPDGAVILEMSRGGNENSQIYRLDLATGKRVLLTDGKARNDAGRFNRAGTALFFRSNRRTLEDPELRGRDTDIWTMDPLRPGEASVLMQITGEHVYPIDWSFDDARLLMLRYVSANESYPFLFDVAGKGRTPIPIPGGVKAAHDAMAFLPDGGVLLSTDAHGEFKELVRFDARLNAGRLTQEIAWDVTDVEVSPKGDRAVFALNEEGATRVFELDLKDGTRRPLDLPLGVVENLRFSPDGRRLGLTLFRPDAPGDAYVWADGKLERWTFSEVGGLNPAAFVRPELVRVKSFDGLTVPAYVYRPRGAAGRVPVVIQIHGGPESQTRPMFSPLVQFWVNELGVAVVAPNVRGSSGYGKTYLTLDNGRRRLDSVRDIGAILDWIATQPDLDAARVAVEGGSYGGFMVLASLVMFADRIKAGVDNVGIADFVTFLEKTERYRVDLRRVEYGDERDPQMRKFLQEISPARNADKIRAALLVLHGENDPRVPVGEARLIASKVPGAWTIIASNEGHGFAKKENSDYATWAMTLFLQRHLLGR